MKTVLFILIGLLIFTQSQLLGKIDLNDIASGIFSIKLRLCSIRSFLTQLKNSSFI